MEIVKGVHRIEGLRGSNVYLLVDEKLALVDTGMSGNHDRIIEYIRGLGRDPSELTNIIVTHGHFDHMGSLYKLRNFTGAKTIAHKQEVIKNRQGKYFLSPFIETSQMVMILLALGVIRLVLRLSGIEIPLYGIIALRSLSLIIGLLILGFISVPKLWFERVLFHFAEFKHRTIDILVEDGDLLQYAGGTLIVHTPGHTPGSICLFLPESRVLIAGDTIINNKDRLSRPLPIRSSRDDAEESLKKLAQLDFDICCFGHGPPLYSAKESVVRLALNYPKAPVWWRIIRNWQRLVRFIAGLFQRH